MTVTVEIATHVTDVLVAGLNRLLPQLSSSAAPLTVGQVEVIVGSPTSTLFVARDGDRVVGTLTLVVFAIPTGVRAWIEDVVVDESFRGGGAGEALTLAAIDQARAFGVRSIDLTSRPSRVAAHALYVKLGFEARETNVFRLSLD
jgi:ribosomal protein S18 acetylase RimI-like enzyme